jgi:hypothetical protein
VGVVAVVAVVAVVVEAVAEAVVKPDGLRQTGLFGQ